MKQILGLVLLLLLVAVPSVVADVDWDEELTTEEEALVDEILEPVMSVYNAIKYIMTVVGVLALVFAGISFVTAGGEQTKKNRAKAMIAGVIVGLILIWVAPTIVEFVFT
jgi:amino acid transporter